MIVENKTLSIFTYKSKSGKYYKVAFYKGIFYFVHISKNKKLEVCTSKKGSKFLRYTGNFNIEGNVITI